MRLHVSHRTRYRYPAPVSNSYNELRLMPVSDLNQTCVVFEVETMPGSNLFSYDLPSGRVHHFDIREPHRELDVQADAIVETHRGNPYSAMQFVVDDGGYYRIPDIHDCYAEYLAPTERVPLLPEVDVYARQAREDADTPATAWFLLALIRLLHREFAYVPGATDVDTPIKTVLAQKHGVCQDFAHVMLAICRREGIPARYVSGYLFTGGTNTLGEDLVSGQASHAWVECLLPGGVWHGFDPTNNMVANDVYVKVQHGRDYGDVSPIRGIYQGPTSESMTVSVIVSEMTEEAENETLAITGGDATKTVLTPIFARRRLRLGTAEGQG